MRGIRVIFFFYLQYMKYHNNINVLSAGSVNFQAKLRLHSTSISTDFDEIYKAFKLFKSVFDP